MKKYLVEFIGTFFLVLTIGMTVIAPVVAVGFAPLAIGALSAALAFLLPKSARQIPLGKEMTEQPLAS